MAKSCKIHKCSKLVPILLGEPSQFGVYSLLDFQVPTMTSLDSFWWHLGGQVNTFQSRIKDVTRKMMVGLPGSGTNSPLWTTVEHQANASTDACAHSQMLLCSISRVFVFFLNIYIIVRWSEFSIIIQLSYMMFLRIGNLLVDSFSCVGLNTIHHFNTFQL